VTSLFQGAEPTTRFYCYRIRRRRHRLSEAGAASLSVGEVDVESEVTGDAMSSCFGALHFGDHNVIAGVTDAAHSRVYRALTTEVTEAFGRADLPVVVRALDRLFEGNTYSLRDLFVDEQRRVLDQVLASSLTTASAAYRDVHGRYGALMRYLADLGQPLPRAFAAAAELVVQTGLRDALEAEWPDVDRARSLLSEAEQLGLSLDAVGLGRIAERRVHQLVRKLMTAPDEPGLLALLVEVSELARELPFPVDLWHAQNAFYELSRQLWRERLAEAEAGSLEAQGFCQVFRALGEALGVRVR
jgi:hypothetical protein